MGLVKKDSKYIWNFDKFIGSDNTLGLQMKSVGEVMSIGRTFRESIQKALRSLEVGLDGFDIKDTKYRKLDPSICIFINENRYFFLYKRVIELCGLFNSSSITE